MKKIILSSFVFVFATTVSSLALDSNERTFFGLSDLANTRPEINGSGYSVGVSDTEFDVTHPGLGWTGADEYNTWFYNRQYIPLLNRTNPRIFMAAHNTQADTAHAERHGAFFTGFTLPVSFNNTLMTNIWSFHGTAVAGTAAGGQPGPLGNSLGAAHQARLVLAGNSASFPNVISLVPDGNPGKTVAMNRSFTGSSSVDSEARRNSGVIGVNAAGNYFTYRTKNRTQVYGTSPHISSIRWLDEVGYDLIASGLTLENDAYAYTSSSGSMRNQESIFTDYSVTTLRPHGIFDSGASGTSFASPLLAGGITLVQQAYNTANPGSWLRVDQMQRILKKSGKFVDGKYTGLRYPVANFAAAVALAETYEGDPSFEPNFSTSFDNEPRVNWALGETYFLNPLQFRVSTSYGSNEIYEYTTAVMDNGKLHVGGDTAGGNVNVALRNNWGDLARVDLTEPNKKFTALFNYETSSGAFSGDRTEFFIGIKEMYGSMQFMDADRMGDNIDRGRLAFRITYSQGDSQARIDLLQCLDAPVTSNPWYYEPVWQRSNFYAIPEWDASPLATVYVSNLHNGSNPQIEASFTSARAVLKINGTTLIDAAHNAPQAGLSRSTPYMHFRNVGAGCRQDISAFEARTESGAIPVVTKEDVRLRAIEGVNGVTAKGVITVRRTTEINQPLTVHYNISGSAANGSDYTLLPGSITIPANKASVDIVVNPINDNIAEGNESVYIDLTPNGSYIISPYSATGGVTIVDYSDIDNDGIESWNEDVNQNGNLSDDDSNANMLPNYLDVNDTVPTNNVAPVANAGDDVFTTATAPVALDGSTSYDVDGTIEAYVWTVLPGDNGPVSINNANSATPTVNWSAPTATDRTIQIQLTVTDNHGATAFDTVSVTQKSSPIYNKYFNQVYFRGTPNGWGTTQMELVDHNTWELQVNVGFGEQKYKFDIYGNWSLNFGDNNSDGYADISGNDIVFTQGDGMYIVRFNDLNHWYSAVKFVPNQPPTADAGDDVSTFQMEPVILNGFASFDPDGSIASYQWTIIEGGSGPVYLNNADTAAPTIGWHAPALSTRVARVQLTVTDDDGATGSDIVAVTQVSTDDYDKTFDQVYFRGSANGWGTTSMELVSNYTWQIQADFNSGNNNRFKLDINGDWSFNFGDNNNDGYADQGGGDIAVTQGNGTYIIWFNDQTHQYAVNKVVGNQAPVANAGQDQVVELSGATVTFDGNGSYDPDGSIASFSWTQTAGPSVSMNGTGLQTLTAFILSRTTETTYTFELKVTDNQGAIGTDTVTVTQKAAGFDKVYNQVYFRGSANSWGTTTMTLVSNHVWETEQTFGSGSNERFKFDINGDWSQNFGDNNNDGIADIDGNDIGISQGSGTYVIRFNDNSKAYTVNKVGGGAFTKIYNKVSVAGTMNGWNPDADNMTLIDNNTWSGTFTLSGSVSLKITANGSWGTNWGENNQPGTSAPLNGYLENGGGNINLNNLPGATYRITMHEQTRAYSVVILNGSEAGASRNLVGWEAKYSLDLLESNNGSDDPDEDTLSNMDEYNLGTNPFAKDTDRDGMCDWSEVVSATDPLDNGDFLAAAPYMTAAGMMLEWRSEPSRLYRLEASRNLSEWEAVNEWMSSVDASGTMTAPATEDFFYFRVRVSEMGTIGTTD